MIYFIIRTRKLNGGGGGMLASHERKMVVLLLQAAPCWTCGLAEGLERRGSPPVWPPPLLAPNHPAVPVAV